MLRAKKKRNRSSSLGDALQVKTLQMSRSDCYVFNFQYSFEGSYLICFVISIHLFCLIFIFYFLFFIPSFNFHLRRFYVENKNDEVVQELF